MANEVLRIGLASAANPSTVEERLAIVGSMLDEAARRNVAIVCFPEAYLPGLRGMDFEVPPVDQARQVACLEAVQEMARASGVCTIIPMEWSTEKGTLNLAFVIDRDGKVQGYQAKNQIAPAEDPYYQPDGARRLFTIDGIPFGITICHEGWRYPESVRWSAVRGARIVFHPHMTGSDNSGVVPKRWGDPDAPYYEKAMMLRACENEIWFASVNCATAFQESATTLVAPDGSPVAYVPYGEQSLLVHDVDLALATGIYADRFRPEFYPAD